MNLREIVNDNRLGRYINNTSIGKHMQFMSDDYSTFKEYRSRYIIPIIVSLTTIILGMFVGSVSYNIYEKINEPVKNYVSSQINQMRERIQSIDGN